MITEFSLFEFMDLLNNISIFVIGLSLLFLLFHYYNSHRRQLEFNRESERKKYTYEYCMKINPNDYISRMNQHMFFEINVDEALSDDDNEMLEPLELATKIAMGVQIGILDEAIIRRMLGSFLTSIYTKYKIVMIRQRERTNSSYLYSEFEMLIERWERTKLNIEKRSII